MVLTKETLMEIDEVTEVATEAMKVALVEEIINVFTISCALSQVMELGNATEGLINNSKGPTPILSGDGYRYYTVFVDTYTRYSWTYPLHLKSDVFNAFVKFKTMVELQLNKKIKQEIPSLAAPPIASHSMLTRSKNGIFRPRAFLTNCSLPSGFLTELEPKSVKIAIADPKWLNAMNAEFEAFQKNKTWSLVPALDNMNIVGSKWVFQTNPVVKPSTIRVIFTLAVFYGWDIRQVDINNAFLNGDL
ncbi:hypothetical protein EZV62_024367 [Acer yangbiense]|uniref:Reverse transcriptase Ty1/copia-type domain-containing protein n=1 Tax=Acer yangbiense TaxID=1000413 RepID=A0A5C7GVZ4_9ROSI|nr:hypothetical protein EZV62_024367 [Acer yangbiense]